MSMFPHVVTLYNTKSIELPENKFEPTLVNHITVLRGVLLDASKGVNVNKSGLEGADAVTLYIPVNVDAVDGLTGRKKRYVGPREFWNADDKTGPVDALCKPRLLFRQRGGRTPRLDGADHQSGI